MTKVISKYTIMYRKPVNGVMKTIHKERAILKNSTIHDFMDGRLHPLDYIRNNDGYVDVVLCCYDYRLCGNGKYYAIPFVARHIGINGCPVMNIYTGRIYKDIEYL